METRPADRTSDATPYPVPEEAEDICRNTKMVKMAAEEERSRRVQEHAASDQEAKILREINIEYAVAAMETERIRRVSHHNLAEAHSEMIRETSKNEVVLLMEEERCRRMSEDNLARVHSEMHRESAKKEAVHLMEAERARRVSQEQMAQVHNEMHREQSKKEVLVASETERARRVSQSNVAELQSRLDRRKSIGDAIQLAEAERTRRVKEHGDQKLEDHVTRMTEQSNAVNLMELERVRRMSDAPKAASSSFLYSAEASREVTEFTEPMAFGTSAAPVSPTTSPPKPIPTVLPELPVASVNPEQEKQSLYELQNRLRDDLPPCGPEADAMRNVRLLRFLRGHKGNVNVAAERYSAMLALRQKHSMDQIRDNIVLGNMTVVDFPYYEKIKRYMPAVAAYDVMDCSHNVYCFEKIGAYDIYGLMVNVSDDEWLAYSLHEMEHRALTLDKLSVQHRTMVRCNVIRDLDGFSLTRISRPALNRVQNMVSLASACYPEMVQRTLFINTPWVFQTVWKGIKLWLNDTQREKIGFLKRGEKEQLYNVCPPEKLPELMGGTNTSVVVPSSGLLGKDSYGTLRENGATEAEIRARGVLQVPFRVNGNDTVCWEFSVFAYDVDFTIKFRTQGDGGAEEHTVDGWDKTRFVYGQIEAGSWTAPGAGVAVLCWDNTFSWTRAKTICYKASVARGADDADAIDISGHHSL